LVAPSVANDATGSPVAGGLDLAADVREGVVYQMRDGRPYPLPNIKRLDTTMRPMPDTVGEAIDRAQDEIDHDAADIGVAAVVLAEAINPGGSKAGRNALADDLASIPSHVVPPRTEGPREIELTVYSVRDGGNRLGVRCEPEYQHGLRIGDFITMLDIEYVVCDIDKSPYSGLVFIDIKRTAPERGIKEKDTLTFTVGGGA
jgi:hypothetical protein